MKNLALVIVLMTFSSHSFAQDIIVLKSGEEIQSKVVEVAIDLIKYKKFENLDGPIYSVHKSDVFMIKYENGQKEVIKTVAPSEVINQKGSNNFTSADIKKAKDKSVFGYVAIAPVMILAVAAASADDGTVLGGVATTIFAVSFPLAAGGGARLREKSGVNGNTGLRVAAWIGYGLTLTDAIVAVGLGASEIEVPPATVISIGLLGSLSLALIASDINLTARQANRMLSSNKISISPTLGYVKSNQKNIIPTLGFQIRF